MSHTANGRAASLEPHTLAFLKALEAQGGPPVYTLAPADARNVLLGAQTSGQVAKQPAALEDRTINAGPTGTISLRIVRPAGSACLLPGVMYFHGGGWVLGDKETHDRLVRELVNSTQSTLVFVDYARSPEARYPIAIEQAYSATVWVAENGATIGVDTSRLAVVGDSAGGNMAAVVTLLAKQRQGPKINLQVLFYPVTDADLGTGSYCQFGDGRYWLATAGMQWFWDSYVAADQRQEPTVSPLQATMEQLQGLPSALIITAENDVLRDEGEAYAHKLIAAGVVVTATRYLGTIHDFVMLNAITNTPAARAAIAQASAALRNAFAR
jgi:acetyl esterase